MQILLTGLPTDRFHITLAEMMVPLAILLTLAAHAFAGASFRKVLHFQAQLSRMQICQHQGIANLET